MQGRPLVPGTARGSLLVSAEPLSFWGGYDPATGEIIDRRHALSGEVARGRILAVPETRGSSTTTAVLLEAIRADTAPAAILTTDEDAFFALAGIVAEEMYGSGIPILAVDNLAFERLKTGQQIRIDIDGTVHLDD